MRQNMALQFPPLPPLIKKLMIINAAIWFVGLLIIEKNLLDAPYITRWFGLTPAMLLNDFMIWQPLTYMFLHSLNMWHIIFNMLMLWWLGAELETIWGKKKFLTYYLVCGVGAGVLYSIGVILYSYISGDFSPMMAPVVGASGAIFGLIVAYGILFSEREVYFLFLFKMKAKHFVMLLGAFEVVSLLNSGFSTQVANLAHLMGALVGAIYLIFWTNIQKGPKNRAGGRGRKLKLVVNNEVRKSSDEPKYWN